MSSGDRIAAARPFGGRTHLRQAGHTALEIMIALALMAVLSLAVERTITAAQRAENHLGSIRKVLKRGEKLGYDLREIVGASRKLFQGDATGMDYLDALDLYDPTPPVAGLRLPIFDEMRGLGPDDPGDPRTGNAVLFVREADAAPAVANPATGKLRYIDTYRFVCIYVGQTDRYIIDETNRQQARDLILWRSIAFPSHGQILSVSDPVERASVVADLFDRFGYGVCWDPAGAVDAAFYDLDVDGTVAAAPTKDITIELDPDLAERGKLVYANVQLAPTSASTYERRAILTVDDPAVWSPDGFEVKIVGASGARKVWMHLVIETQAAKGWVAAHSSTVIASTKDM